MRTYQNEVWAIVNTGLLFMLRDLAINYTTNVDNIAEKFESVKLQDTLKPVLYSKELTKLTNKFLSHIKNIEKMMDEFEAVLSKIQFHIRQEYNIVRYKLDTSLSAFNWDFYGKANYRKT